MIKTGFSPWLTKYVKKRGGSMFITTRMTIAG